MEYPDDLEHMVALSELIDAWVRRWRCHRYGRNCQRWYGMDCVKETMEESSDSGRDAGTGQASSHPDQGLRLRHRHAHRGR
jgi:hypothetical protein